MASFHDFYNYVLSLKELHDAHKDDYVTSVLKNNFIIIYTGAVLSIVMQLFNIIRVLNSSSKLQTANNRFYFFFYIALFIVAFIPIIFRNHWPQSKTATYCLQLTFGIFYILWNLLLNSFTMNMQTSSSIIIFTSALIFTSILFHFKPMHTIIVQVLAYALFLMLNYAYLSYGNMTNLTIAVVTTVFCTLILYVQELNLIHSRLELIRANQDLQNSEDMLRIGLEKHQFIMEETSLFSFDWNLIEDTLIPSRNCSEILNWPATIRTPFSWVKANDNIFPADQSAFLNLMRECVKTKSRSSIDIRIKDQSLNYTWYRLQLFIQCDHNGKPTTAIGVLLNIDGPTRLIRNLNKQLHSQLEGTKQYLEQLKDSQEQAIIYRHDMRHSLKLMEQLAHQGNLEKLCSYLAETHTKLESITPNYYCENETVNLILSSFYQLAHQQNITFVTDIVLPPELPLADTEIASLLFNLLENALTAANTSGQENLRYVKVRAAFNYNKLLIFTENGFDGEIIMKDELPISPNESNEHGFGIKSIINIVEQYNGLYTFETKKQVFFAKILLEI